MTDVDKLVQVIRDLHGVEATHVRSEPVHETFRGELVWDGVVEVCDVRGHAVATRAYAWSHETDEGGRRYVAVLQVPPVVTPVDAVRAAIAAAHRAR
jgi:hypothetical protein